MLLRTHSDSYIIGNKYFFLIKGKNLIKKKKEKKSRCDKFSLKIKLFIK